MNWYLHVLQQYAVFRGRARRREYWMFVLIHVAVVIVLTSLDITFGWFDPAAGAGVLSALYAIATLVPSLAVTIRRLHDIDRTGWWIMLGFVPIVGPLVLFVFSLLPGTAGPNRHGPDPLGPGNDPDDSSSSGTLAV